MDELALAVDIGTSSVRVMLFDAYGQIHGRTQYTYTTTRPAPYFEEQNPDLVCNETLRAITDCLKTHPDLVPSIRAMAFSSQLYGVIALDANDNPITQNIIWSDGRAEPQAEFLKAQFGENWLYPETGCPMNSIFPLAKILWLRELRPEVFKATKRFVSIKEYVTWRLIGQWKVDYSMASATGMFDIRKHQWHERALDYLQIREDQLSEPVSGLEPFRLVEDSPLFELGLRKNFWVFLGAGDGPLANLGSGASSVGAVNIDLGTSGAARCITDAAAVDTAASLWCFCLTDSLWAFGGIVTNVGNAYQWLSTNLLGPVGIEEKKAYASLDSLAEIADAGNSDLQFLPYLRKARSPYWDGRLKGTIYGLTASHDMGHIARAMLEAIAYDLKAIVGIMKRNRLISEHIVLTGGVSKSPILPQLLADVLGQEIRTPDDCEGSIAGAALFALKGEWCHQGVGLPWR